MNSSNHGGPTSNYFSFGKHPPKIIILHVSLATKCNRVGGYWVRIVEVGKSWPKHLIDIEREREKKPLFYLLDWLVARFTFGA